MVHRMSDEPKDLRIPIMMSASEVKAIDDWSFNNRIRTRAEAVRRLCQMALIWDRYSDDLRNTIDESMHFILDNTTLLMTKIGTPETQTDIGKIEYIVESGQLLMNIIEKASYIYSLSNIIDIPLRNIRESGSTDDAIRNAPIDIAKEIVDHLEMKLKMFETKK